MSKNIKPESLQSEIAITPILTSRYEWMDWNRNIQRQIKIAGYGDLLRNPNPPENADKKAIWKDKQERLAAPLLLIFLLILD
jgi:hypothetical protein